MQRYSNAGVDDQVGLGREDLPERGTSNFLIVDGKELEHADGEGESA